MGQPHAASEELAARRQAVGIARRMLTGELAPHEGAQAIADQVWARVELRELAGFVAAAGEWHTCPELRDALAADALDPAGVYFGTRNGKLFASPNEGKSWSAIADGLPPVVCVKTARVSLPRRSRKSA
jgi:hypothetical protein